MEHEAAIEIDINKMFAMQELCALRWTRKIGQVAKRESCS